MIESSGRKRGRAPVVATAIADDVRRQIAMGKLGPGMQLPRRLEMQRIYDASPVTIQSAMDVLKADGVLETHGRGGTFVAENAPLVTNLALVFHAARHDPYHWNRFYDALTASAAGWRQEPERHFAMYHCSPTGETTAESQRLLADLRALRFGGVIHITGMLPDDVLTWQQEFMMPFVAVTTSGGRTKAPAHVNLSYDSFLARAVEHVAGRGRKRIGILVDPVMWFDTEEACFDRAVARCGVEARAHHRQLVSITVPVCARSAAHVLMRLPPEDRPDALIVADDNLGPHAVQGLRDAGVVIGADLDVVVHANFPSASEFRDLPVTRLGFDAREVLESAVRVIDRWRETGIAGGRAEVEARFEAEVA